MAAEGTESVVLFRPRPAIREEIALALDLGRARPDPLWLTALLGAAGMILAGFLLYAFSVVASAMEFKHSKGAGPMRHLCRAVTWLLIGIPPFCAVTFVLDRLSARGKLRELQGDLGEGFVEAARIQPLDVLRLDYPSRRKPDLVVRIGETRALVLRALGTHPGDNLLPNTDFEIVRLRETQRVLYVVSHGQAIENVKRRDGTQLDLRLPECEPFEVDWASLTAGAS